MARVHVKSWQETYRGLKSGWVLDAPDFVERRERFWTAALSDERFASNRAAVAELGGEIVGIASAGPASGADSPDDWQLYVLYVLYLLALHHGSGAGQRLIDEVLGDRAAILWVADPNPRAQAFYRKNGFAPDGRAEYGTSRNICMVRGPRVARG
jgi:GNAT superfamily N-acetyltransferase